MSPLRFESEVEGLFNNDVINVLGCAVKCAQKGEYITRIMELELSCQRSIMQAIQVRSFIYFFLQPL